MAVHDASSLLAIAFREPGAEVALSKLADSLISSVNWSEVVQKVARRGGRTETLATLFEGLGVKVVPFERGTAERAASLYEPTKHLGLSLGDRACLALGLERGLEVVCADRAWAELELDVPVTVIR